jgi:hypothetical protein
LFAENEPERVDHAGESAQEGEDDIDPEVGGNADLKEGGNRGKEDATDDFNEFHEGERIRS